MIIISHRGNTNGRNKSLENNPIHIDKLLKSNIQVEIDVWFKNGLLLLGHDKPEYIIKGTFLKNKGLWCHAKNLSALEYMLKNNIQNSFWHQEDDFTITSSGYIWTYPNKSITSQSIIVDLNKNWKTKNYNCFGVCVDFVY
ncbi:MAG: Paramecium bursaria Chlorella virus [Pseudomonadota bacterium]|jgi:hypothetical protein